MKKITADFVITNTGQPIPNGVVIYNEESGRIIDVLKNSDGIEGVQYFKGLLVPGYINAHCHLELSHLKNVIPTGTGLIPFIKDVVSLRDFPQEQIDQEIYNADLEMSNNGIVAVGDISNKLDTAKVKSKSGIRYYTFVEAFDFLQESNADKTFEKAEQVFNAFSTDQNQKKSYVPHAPYSVSKKLFKLINQHNQKGATISIHNQELEAENELFKTKTGAFLDFFDSFGISISDFEPIGKPSIYYALRHLRKDYKTLMVHNTTSTKADISAAQLWNNETYWATCPNANLYIENALPRYDDFIDCGAKLCIGTDSLSSNWQLSIFEEMCTIKKYQSGIDDLEIIKWATINGAKALGYDDLGYLEKNLASGINHIDVEVSNKKFDLSRAKSSSRLI